MLRLLNPRIVLLLAIAAPAAAAAPAQRPPVEAFGNLPNVDDIKLSPGGKKLAVLRRHEGRRVVMINHDFRNHAQPEAYSFDGGHIEGISWANDERLLVLVDRERPGSALYGTGREYTRVVSVMAATGQKETLFRRRFPHERDHSARIGSWITAWLPDDSEHVLMPFFDSDGTESLYRVNVNNGRNERIAKGTRNTRGWDADRTGARLLRWDVQQETGEAEWLYRLPGEDWKTLLTHNLRDGTDFVPLAFAPDPDILYVIALRHGFDAIYKYDLKARKMGRVFFAHDNADVDGLILDRYTGKPVAAHFTVHRPGIHYFDAGYAALQKKLDQTFRATPVNRVISSTRGGTAHIISISGPASPKRFFYYNRRENRAFEVGRAYPKLLGVELGSVRMLTYKARDGLTIPAYLTLPPGAQAKNLPAVILPHGGPQARDVLAFDYWAQFLANRGYAVLQPQFRGSKGFGEAFEKGGEQEWGGLMQDDVTDGVKHLIAEGIADPERICIMGGSYGGYAALMGAVKTPDLYKCAISVAGVSDLLLMLRSRRSRLSVHYWKRHIGDPDKDRKKLIAASPARQARKIKIPILLIHGKDDLTVPYEHSELMAQRLRQAGVPYKLVPLEGEDHHMTYGKTRIAALREAEAFLAEHLGGKTR